MAEADDRSGGGRGIPDTLREAIEGAFEATARTRDRATELSGKTMDRAQGLVGEVSRRGQEARDSLDRMRLVAHEELKQMEERLDALSRRVEELERKSGRGPDG